MLASLAVSTLKQYQVVLRQWSVFCGESDSDVFDANRSKVMQLLMKRFQEGASYGSLNTARSALSLISREKIGDDKEISRLLKGCFKLKPSAPKYSKTWDVAVVLSFLSKLYPLDNISLLELTKKTVTLLALCTGQRAQTLSKIKIKNIVKNEDGLEIRIDELIKTSGPGRSQPLLVIPYFLDNESICVASAVLKYIEVTECVNAHRESLFIAIRKPYKAVSAQTISRWIKQTLGDSGIDTAIFTAHSTRHAATSRAFNVGVDLDTIRRSAGWSKGSEMFARVYNRPVMSNKKQVFARSILSSIGN